MTASPFRSPGRQRADPDRLFRALYSFSGLSNRAVLLLGVISVVIIGLVEWGADLPIPTDVVFALIVGGVTFHGRAISGISVAVLAGCARVVSTGAPATRTPETWPLAAVEGLALVALLFGLILLAGALHRAIDALQQQTQRDPLTGALNSRGFMEAAERERLRALRDGHPLTIAYFDIDGLKEVNDGSGHQAGDLLLLSFTKAVVDSIRAHDIFARLGGDEFVLVLPATYQPEALSAISRIRDRLVERTPQFSMSAGLVTYSAPSDPLEDLLRTADGLMYRAKQSGGNRVVGQVQTRPAYSNQGEALADLTAEQR